MRRMMNERAQIWVTWICIALVLVVFWGGVLMAMLSGMD
jgi:hypothetical protein